MRAHQHAAPLVVVRSEAEAGRVGLRLIGELDLNTVVLLEAELAGSREHAPPAVIDLSELRFLDLVGLRALLRLGQAQGVPDTRLVGATGIVRRLIELTRVLDAEQAAAGEPFPGEPTTTVTSEVFSRGSRAATEITANGYGSSPKGAHSNGNGTRRAAVSDGGDAA